MAAFLSAFRAAQPLLKVIELRIPAADVRQQIRIRSTFVRARGALDDD
jgi:hypothetical protein